MTALTEADLRHRRWATFGVVEREKELARLQRAMPASAAIPDLNRCLDKRCAEVVLVNGGNRIEAERLTQRDHPLA